MIREEIKKQLVEAMKNQEKEKVATLRLINSSIKDRDIADRSKGNYDGIDEAGILSLLQTMIKQRRESIEMYKQGGRDDLVAHEQGEIDVIQSFLPKQMSAEEMQTVIKEVIAQTGATGMKDMGKVMGVATKRFAGRADGKVVSTLVRQLLAE